MVTSMMHQQISVLKPCSSRNMNSSRSKNKNVSLSSSAVKNRNACKQSKFSVFSSSSVKKRSNSKHSCKLNRPYSNKPPVDSHHPLVMLIQQGSCCKLPVRGSLTCSNVCMVTRKGWGGS